MGEPAETVLKRNLDQPFRIHFEYHRSVNSLSASDQAKTVQFMLHSQPL